MNIYDPKSKTNFTLANISNLGTILTKIRKRKAIRRSESCVINSRLSIEAKLRYFGLELV